MASSCIVYCFRYSEPSSSIAPTQEADLETYFKGKNIDIQLNGTIFVINECQLISTNSGSSSYFAQSLPSAYTGVQTGWNFKLIYLV